MNVLEKSVVLPVDQNQAFDYHDRAGALQRLIPPWEKISIESTVDGLEVGNRVVLKAGFLGLPLRYVAKHTIRDRPQHFQDVQEKGPFDSWCHDHRFEAIDSTSCRLTDHVAYRLPLRGTGQLLGGAVVRRKLEAMFRYRHTITRDDLQMAADSPLAPRRIAVSGSTGLVGKQLCPLLRMLGHRVDSLVRHASHAENEIAIWDESEDDDKLRGLQAVIHLAGKPIAAERWSSRIKEEIRLSRVVKTAELCRRLARLGDDRPDALLCASATGYYGDRGDAILTEDSSRGEGFLADVAEQWERACQPAVDAGIRVVHLRFGVILTPAGGALAKTLLPAQLGAGRLGSGKQWWSWIAIDDVLGAIWHALAHTELQGPVNVVAPEPISNGEFTRTLGRILHRPTIVPAPAPMLRLALGEMADALLLASSRVLPERLLHSGYRFRFPQLEPALRHLLGR